MITVSRGTIEKKPAEYFKKVEQTGEEIIVTRNKVPVFKIISLRRTGKVEELFADVRGKIKYRGDLMQPETEEWGNV